MPLSHLTLTVSHLPTSTSFFLSCLQPLGYKFIGRHDEYIGFGTKADEPADFWLAQEQPGTPAGAAHIAFPAPTKEAVNTFFISALKAGGKIHGEPKLRDPETGYFSAAVVDFDGNSIEAVYRPDPSTSTSTSSGAGDGARSEAGFSTSRSTTSSSSRMKGPAALQTIKNGSVVSRARSVHHTEDRAVQAAIENIPPSRVKMLDQSVASMPLYSLQSPQQQQQQQAYVAQNDGGSSISAKTIIGTLLGATAGAAIAYAMIKGDSSSNSNTSTPPAPNTAALVPAASQYIQQQQPSSMSSSQQQQQQPLQIQPMMMPMLGPAPTYQEPVYRALEAPPPPPPPQAPRSTYTANDAISAYNSRSGAGSISGPIAPKSKSPRADTIYEETEYYAPISMDGRSNPVYYSQESSTINAGGPNGSSASTTSNNSNNSGGVRRTANGSMYATRELPIRAIEYSAQGAAAAAASGAMMMMEAKARSKSYPCDPSTFVSSYAETPYRQHQHQQQGHIIGETESEFSSISTIKPTRSFSSSSVPGAGAGAGTGSVTGSRARGGEDLKSDDGRRSVASRSSGGSKHSSHRHDEEAAAASVAAGSATPSARSAHRIVLPESRPGSTYTSATKASKRSNASTVKPTASPSTVSTRDRDRERELELDAYEIPLPTSIAPSTVFLDAEADLVSPEDSISQVGINRASHSHSHAAHSSSGRSHRSKSHQSNVSSASKRERERERERDRDRDRDRERERDRESSSKFDQPIRPSDSISQVSINHRHSSSSQSHHSSHSHSHNHSQNQHKTSSRVSERTSASKKSHSGGSRSSGHH